MKKFNLNTISGLKETQEFVGYDFLPILAFNPLNIAKLLLDKIFSTPEEQGRIINDIIEKGRKEGVDEMEIEFHDKGGFNLNAPIDGCKVDVHIGKDQNVRLNVRYKK